ncbi:MAG: transcription termination/antitermination NusG family protein [Deltaproteobacteria bacterium]|nr:transcription termination/antitermination NusG family protein [Deltaproteobacteria bacterium]
MRARPQLLARAIINMERQGFECYAPHAMMRGGRARRLRRCPLFMGYVFARHPEARWVSLRGTFGVLGVIMGTGERPAPLPHAEIERLRAREGRDGLIKLQECEFEQGERVHLERGVVSLDAIVDGMSGPDRVFVLMQVLGRWTRAEVSVGNLSRG